MPPAGEKGNLFKCGVGRCRGLVQQRPLAMLPSAHPPQPFFHWLRGKKQHQKNATSSCRTRWPHICQWARNLVLVLATTTGQAKVKPAPSCLWLTRAVLPPDLLASVLPIYSNLQLLPALMI